MDLNVLIPLVLLFGGIGLLPVFVKLGVDIIQRFDVPQVATANVRDCCEKAKCQRVWPCRYRDARQCAHDTMLGDECPRVCDCACHDSALNNEP